MFATAVIKTESVITQTSGQSILIDLTDKQEITVSYKVNEGWNNPPHTKWFDAGSELAPILIIPSQQLYDAAQNELRNLK
jgi:hypothetical protein